jgi:hypothetical protein
MQTIGINVNGCPSASPLVVTQVLGWRFAIQDLETEH